MTNSTEVAFSRREFIIERNWDNKKHPVSK